MACVLESNQLWSFDALIRMRNGLPLLLLLLLTYPGISQSLPADSLFRRQVRENAIARYEQAMTPQSAIYNGNEYIQHDYRIKVHPFFQTDSLRKGTVAYYSINYHDVPMIYDIVRDEVSIRHLDGGYRLRLNSEKVDRFTIGDHQFVRLTGDSLVGVRTGFYDQLYTGRTQVLSKRVKVVLEDISTGVYKAEYLTKDVFFVKRDNAFYSANSLGAALNAYADQKKALRKYLRTMHLNFKKDKEQTLVALAKQYDVLTR